MRCCSLLPNVHTSEPYSRMGKIYALNRRTSVVSAIHKFQSFSFGALKEKLWNLCIALTTEVRLFNAYILPILLYGSEVWTFGRREQQRIDAFGTKCLHLICGIKWSDFVNNATVYERAGQSPICSMIRKRRLGLFGHIVLMPATADVRQALMAQV